MKDAPAFDFYAERWLAGTMHLSAQERGAYINLLCYQWLHGSIPQDTASLTRLCGCRPSPAILEKFSCGVNAMLESVRDKQRERIETAREKGRKMAAGRWAKGDAQAPSKQCTSIPQASPKQCTSIPQASPKQCLGDAHHSPLTHVLLEKEPKGADAPEPVRKSALKAAFPLPPTVDAALRSLYHRKDSTPWSAKESSAARPLRNIPEAQLLADLELFTKTRAAGWQFYRRDAFTLMNNWSAEVERCSDYLRTETNGNHHRPTPRQASIVTRNTAPLPSDSPDLSALDWKPALLPDGE